MLHGVCTVFWCSIQRFEASYCVTVRGSKSRIVQSIGTIMWLPLSVTSLITRKRYMLPNTTGEVMWSCNVIAIEHEREERESSVF